MKRRALVSKWGRGAWHVCHVRGTRMDGQCATFPTHAAALAHALAEVGLTPTNPEEEGR